MKINRSRWINQARELRAGGLALEIPEDDWRDPSRRGLIIRQCGGPLLNSVSDTRQGPTVFVVNLSVTIAMSGFALAAFDVDPPWEANLIFLDDPCGSSREGIYRLFNRDIYPRDSVINHYADGRRIRRRGQSISGFLLAWSLESIPDRFAHGSEIPAFIRIFDQNGDCYPKGINLWVDRSQKRSTRKSRVTKQKPLFEEAKTIKDRRHVKVRNR